jgi:hypothetical protein
MTDTLPRAYSKGEKPKPKGRIPMFSLALEPITIRLEVDQIDVIDKYAWELKITRSEFLRNYIIHSLNLPIAGKCVDDDIFGTMK